MSFTPILQRIMIRLLVYILFLSVIIVDGSINIHFTAPMWIKQPNFSHQRMALKNLGRNAEFWKRVMEIYLSYKVQQFNDMIHPVRNALDRNTSDAAVVDGMPSLDDNKAWQQLHELNSQRMVDLCLSLRGFYLKAGQFLGTRHDFMPVEFTTKLSQLHDQVPPMSEDKVRHIIENELPGSIDSHFTSLDLATPVGSASIAQVHAGVWRATGQKVAVKVQNPESELLMKSDLHNLCALAEFLQRTELKFDILSALKELRSQIGNEFDFKREAFNMDFMFSSLAHIKGIVIPQSIFRTRKLLVMSFIEGDNLTKVAHKDVLHAMPTLVKRTIGKRILNVMSEAWGDQIFCLRLFHGDPHPGNICITRDSQIGLLDWGQVKSLSSQIARQYAQLIVALHSRDQQQIVQAFFDLEVKVSKPYDLRTVEAIAVTMFDTRTHENFVMNPFDPQAAIKQNSVLSMPTEIYFIVRAVQLMRGMCSAFKLQDYSLADKWVVHARRVLAEPL
ncbi:AarF/ABC1/UbiB kinase family protein [archaeon]|nr:MAG: AarF/ABC1/UbiB kinase family protein [archaeon]